MWPFKKKEPIKEQKKIEKSINSVHAIQHHKTRIENLDNEFELLTLELYNLQQDTEQPKSIRNKKIDSIVFRMSIIKYEINIREDLLKWLC